MRVLIAPDSFKGTATAAEIAAAIGEGWRRACPGDTIRLAPMADGGEGTLDALAAAVDGAERVPVVVRGPDDRTVETAWLRLPDGRAVVELASTSGITLLDRLIPDHAHTLGFGDAIAAALDAGATGLILAIGGSASTDGGLGVLRALGLRTTPETAADGPDGMFGSAALDLITSVDRSALRPLPPGGVVVLTDVDAPLTGPHGAAAIFGPQKGVEPARVPVFDARLARWAALFPGTDPATAGAGAAGGVGFGLLVWGATLERGADVLSDLLGLRSLVVDADIVITGEGCWDAQSLTGKAPGLVAELARSSSKGIALIAGTIRMPLAGALAAVGLDQLADEAGDGTDAMRRPVHWATEAGFKVASAVAEEHA